MRELKIHRVYKHFKGDLYFVEGIATHSETQEQLVIYRQISDKNKLWARPLEMFISKVDKNKYPNVKQEYRFEPIN